MSSAAAALDARKTPLHALHESLGARMVTFAGYALPMQYGGGIIKEHQHTRTAASLFDVSHMGQVRVAGSAAAELLEALMPADVAGLAPGRQRYTFLTNAAGGIIDDVMIANVGGHYRLVVNAAHKASTIEYLREHLEPRCTVEVLERALLAVQGPAAAGVLKRLAPMSETMVFMDTRQISVAGVECQVARAGYTGEDGFEISVPEKDAADLARELVSDPDVEPAGLGARDSLRLEAGLCLYGNDIDESTTPIEADLGWAVPKARRPGGARAGGYPGADVVGEQLAAGTRRRRVALLPQSRVPVRAGTALRDGDGSDCGVVTSGGYGPTLGRPVAMGYVAVEHASPGALLAAAGRGGDVQVEVARLPVVPHRYARRRGGATG